MPKKRLRDRIDVPALDCEHWCAPRLTGFHAVRLDIIRSSALPAF